MLLISVVKALLLCVYASVSSEGTAINVSSVSAVFVFGDSFVDQGNNNYINTAAKANFHPYGKDFPGGKPTGRFSNGKTLADVLASALGVKEYIPASLDPLVTDKELQTGVSFASAASGFDPQTATLTSTIPILVQLDMFKDHIRKLKRIIQEKAANDIITNSVVVVVAGNNDLLLSLPISLLQNDIPSYVNMLVKLVLNFTQEINNLGVRKIVVFNVPAAGYFPDVRTLQGGPERKRVDKYNNIAQLFNAILKQQLQFWAASVPQSRVAYIDFYNTFTSLIEKHQEYGFDVADRGCCGTGEIEASYLCNKLVPTCTNDSTFLFWDGFHLTEKGYNILAHHIHQDLVNNLL